MSARVVDKPQERRAGPTAYISLHPSGNKGVGGRRRLNSDGSERPLRTKEPWADGCPPSNRCKLGEEGHLCRSKEVPTNCLSCNFVLQKPCPLLEVNSSPGKNPDHVPPYAALRGTVTPGRFCIRCRAISHHQKTPDASNPRSILKPSRPVGYQEIKAVRDTIRNCPRSEEAGDSAH